MFGKAPPKPDPAAKLTPCPDCQQSVSKKALLCPHCGTPLQPGTAVPAPKKMGENDIEIIGYLLLICLILWFVFSR